MYVLHMIIWLFLSILNTHVFKFFIRCRLSIEKNTKEELFKRFAIDLRNIDENSWFLILILFLFLNQRLESNWIIQEKMFW